MTAEADVPPTMAAPGTAPIAGLTPVNATPGYTMTTPATMGPSPVMPIKLDSLWSPEVPQHSNSTDLAAPATTATHSRPSEAGIDLAAMFISTPAPPTAAGDAATSPIEGLVSAEPSSAAVDPNSSSEPFAEQPFGGFAEAAMAGSPAAADLDQQVVNEQTAAEQEQHDVDSDSEPVSSGSPAAVAMEDATVTEMDDFQPSAPPMSLSHNPTPVKSSRAPAARSSAPPAAAARSTPGRTPGRATLSPAPAGTPASPYPESDDDMPEAEAEYPEEKALLAEALAGGLVMSDSAQQHAEETTAPTADKHAAAAPVEPAAAVDEMLPYAEVETAQQQEYEAHQEQPEELAAAGAEQEQYSEEDLLHDLPTTEDAEDPMEDTEVTPAAAQTADQGTAAAQLEDEQLMADSQAEAAVDGDIDTYTAAGTEAAADEQDTAMEVCDNPAATAAEATPVKESAPAQDADAAMSPEVMSLAFEDAAAAGSRFTSSQATTAAPPKSAMAKPKDAATADKKAAGRKSAHVVLPNPSPVKSSSKPVTGRHSMPGSSSGAGNDTSSSPGHTPFPTKSKVRAATAAAECAAAAKDVTLKKEIAYARAHSALKHYSSKPEQQTDEEMGSPAAAPASASKKSSSGGSRSTTVTSRLLQPTASSMAKYRTSLTSEVDTHVWSPPEAEASAAAPAAAGSIKPRLASKVVVPSPVQKQKAEPSIKALKRAIKDKAEKKAKATVAEHKSSSDTQKVRLSLFCSALSSCTLALTHL